MRLVVSPEQSEITLHTMSEIEAMAAILAECEIDQYPNLNELPNQDTLNVFGNLSSQLFEAAENPEKAVLPFRLSDEFPIDYKKLAELNKRTRKYADETVLSAVALLAYDSSIDSLSTLEHLKRGITTKSIARIMSREMSITLLEDQISKTD